MRLLALLAFLQLATVSGCFSVSTLDHGPSPTPDVPDREDCGEILGSAFRSSDEQAWFTEHCSDWAQKTLGRIEPESPPQDSRSSPDGDADGDDDGGDDDDDNRSDRDDRRDRNDNDDHDEDEADNDANSRRCNEMRGRSYQSQSDRSWYLATCLQAESVPGEPPECGRMRGRPYESPSQRSWFLQNCTASSTSPQAQPTPSGGPDRQNCDEIRGTPYRSNAERNWFRQHCTQQP